MSTPRDVPWYLWQFASFKPEFRVLHCVMVETRLQLLRRGHPEVKENVATTFTVDPGQIHILTGSKLQISGEAASVTVYASSEEVAAEQVKAEERQRVFGFIPNFYVVYDHDAVPLSAKLKFKLALKASTDPVIFAAVAFTAAIHQAGDTPDFGQGAKGYGQRVGA
jgi:hypothetical protein